MDRKLTDCVKSALCVSGLCLTLTAGAQGFPGDRTLPPQDPGGRGGRPPQGHPGGGPFGQGGFGQGVPGIPGQPPMMPGMGEQGSPEMAKKMRQIMVLRAINNLDLSAKHITSALPILKSLRDGEKQLQARAEAMLDEERMALLAAQPGDDDVPPMRGDRLREGTMKQREAEEGQWQSLGREIGNRRADGLRMLVGGHGLRFTAPIFLTNPIDPRGGAGGNVSARPQPPRYIVPGRPDDPNAPPPQPDEAGPAELPEGPQYPAAPQAARIPGAPQDEFVGPAPENLQAPREPQEPARLGPGGRRAPQPGQPGQRGQRPGQPALPGGQGRNLPPPGGGDQFFEQGLAQVPPQPGFMPGPRTNLGELVDLLEQKLAAYRKK